MKNTIFRYFSPGCSFEKDLAAEIMDLDLALPLAFRVVCLFPWLVKWKAFEWIWEREKRSSLSAQKCRAIKYEQ